MLDRLEREAILDLQLELSGLLTERAICLPTGRQRRRRMACSVGDGGG